jgi:DNA invertase Pin-like site-specific DNA recombinase
MSKALAIKKSAQYSENPYENRIGLVYARVSSKRQETEGSGLQSQEGRCISDLRSMGVPYEKSFLDSYSGGGDFMNRPAMRAMLDYIDANPHKKFVVIFDDLSRLARDVEFHFKLKVAFRMRDVVLRCLNYNFDESEEGEFTELIFAGKAQLDRKQNRRQVIQKMKARLDAGYWTFGTKRGYDLIKDPRHGKISIPNKDGLGPLREALEAFATGNLPRKIDSIYLAACCERPHSRAATIL